MLVEMTGGRKRARARWCRICDCGCPENPAGDAARRLPRAGAKANYNGVHTLVRMHRWRARPASLVANWRAIAKCLVKLMLRPANGIERSR